MVLFYSELFNWLWFRVLQRRITDFFNDNPPLLFQFSGLLNYLTDECENELLDLLEDYNSGFDSTLNNFYDHAYDVHARILGVWNYLNRHTFNLDDFQDDFRRMLPLMYEKYQVQSSFNIGEFSLHF